MPSIARVLSWLCRSPACVTILLTGCAGLHINQTTPLKGTSCDYEFAKKLPNPSDPCVPHVNIPGYGFTPTAWYDFQPKSPKPHAAPSQKEPAAPEEIPAQSPNPPEHASDATEKRHLIATPFKDRPTLASAAEQAADPSRVPRVLLQADSSEDLPPVPPPPVESQDPTQVNRTSFRAETDEESQGAFDLFLKGTAEGVRVNRASFLDETD